MKRLQWMGDDFCDFLRVRCDVRKDLVLLVPRQPLCTKEERLLRVMGLAVAPEGEKGLSPAPDIRVKIELVDSAQTGVTFENTPIRIRLSVLGRQGEPTKEEFSGTVGGYDSCRQKAAAWLDGKLPAAAATAPATDDVEEAKRLAAEELALAEPWSKELYWFGQARGSTSPFGVKSSATPCGPRTWTLPTSWPPTWWR